MIGGPLFHTRSRQCGRGRLAAAIHHRDRAESQRLIPRQRAEFDRRGQAAQFDRLKVFLTGDSARGSHQHAATELDMSEAAVRTAVHRLRRRYAELVREEIAATVLDPGEVDDEIRFLLAALERA